MNRRNKNVSSRLPPHRIRTFFQPLTVALVMVVFVSLILFMGVMDLGRLDRTLVVFMENRGLDSITTVENVAQENLNYLYQTLKEEHDKENTFVPLTDKAFSPQETLVKNLVDLAREIDVKWKQEILSEDDLTKIATRENLWLIGGSFSRAGIFSRSSRQGWDQLYRGMTKLRLISSTVLGNSMKSGTSPSGARMGAERSLSPSMTRDCGTGVQKLP